MYKRNYLDEDVVTIKRRIFLLLFVIGYPLLVSIYPMLPPFIGLAGYIMILNFKKEKIYVFASLFYLLNLDLNLTLPLFLSLFNIIFIYMFIYTPLKRLVRCKVCLLFALMVTIDFLYYFLIFLYDFIFGVSTAVADGLLLYFITIDILLGMLL